MSYKIKADGNGSWTVMQNNTPVDGAYVMRIEFDENYTEGENGRTYYLLGSARVTIRLKDGREVPHIPLD